MVIFKGRFNDDLHNPKGFRLFNQPGYPGTGNIYFVGDLLLRQVLIVVHPGNLYQQIYILHAASLLAKAVLKG